MAGRRAADLSEHSTAVLLHGFTGSARSWSPILDGLRSCGFEARAVDLPGHGARSAGQPASIEAVLDAVDQVTEDRDRFDLVGYSMGGRIALHVALARAGRVRTLVLESASPGLETPVERGERRRRDEQLAERIERDGVAAFFDYWDSLPLFASRASLPPDRRRALRRARSASTPEGLASALRGLGTGVLPSLWEALPSVECPTLLLSGGLDPKFVRIAARMGERLPAATSITVPGAGHTVHLEAPGEWVRAVTGFLTD